MQTASGLMLYNKKRLFDYLKGCVHIGSVFLEPDGMFPNHIPNPEEPEAMEAGAKAVLDSKSDLCIVLDTVSSLSNQLNVSQKIQ